MQVWKPRSPMIAEESPKRMEMPMVCWPRREKSEIFLQRWTEVYRPIYPANQWIVSGEPVVSKDQRVGRIKRSNIEVQIYTITGGKYYGQVGNFRDGAV